MDFLLPVCCDLLGVVEYKNSLFFFCALKQIYGYEDLQMMQSRLPIVSILWQCVVR